MMVPEAGIEPARLAARDFLATSAFAATLRNAGCSWSGARLHHSLAAVGARRLLSTPSRALAWAWLGVGSDEQASRAFAEFDGRHFGGFPLKAQIVCSSPLCLPISPLGHGAIPERIRFRKSARILACLDMAHRQTKKKPANLAVCGPNPILGRRLEETGATILQRNIKVCFRFRMIDIDQKNIGRRTRRYRKIPDRLCLRPARSAHPAKTLSTPVSRSALPRRPEQKPETKKSPRTLRFAG